MKFASVFFFLAMATVMLDTAFGSGITSGNHTLRHLATMEPNFQEHCGDVEYEMSIGVEHAHMGIFAQPKEETPKEECGSVFLHAANPSTKLAVVMDTEFDMLLYPLGEYKMEDILKAFDSVPLSDAEYDVVKHSCAELVMQMMCYLEIPIIQEMKDWTKDALLQTETSVGELDTLMHKSPNFGALGVSEQDTYEESVRRLVEYDAGEFTCAAASAEEELAAAEETSGHDPTNKPAGWKMCTFFAMAAVVVVSVLVSVLVIRAGRHSTTDLAGNGKAVPPVV